MTKSSHRKINATELLYLFVIVFLGISLKSSAQTGEIRGTIYDKSSGEPLIYTHVKLLGKGIGGNSDQNGIYTISKIPEGSYTLICNALGFDTFKTTVNVKSNKLLTLNIYLNQVEIGLNEVRIEQNKSQNETRVGLSKIDITPQQIKTMPSVGGEADLAQYLQILPGVVSTGDQGGQLYIRGGSPVQNLVLLDGMPIYNAFHSIGLFSVFDPDIIRNVNVYTGGFDASYGGRISSVMDVNTRDGNQSRLAGDVSISPFVSKLEIEGPLRKFTEDQGGSSYLLSVRGSYLAQSAPVFYPYAGSNGLPYDFLDFYGKLTFNAPGGSKVDLFGFNFNDQVNLPGSTIYSWNSYGLGGKFVLLPSSSSTVIEGHFSYSYYTDHQTDPSNAPRNSDIGGFQTGLDFTYYPGKDLLKYGFEINGGQTDFNYVNSANQLLDQNSYTTTFSAYVHYNKVIGRLVIDPSVRMQFYADLNEFSFEPRIGLKYVLTDKLRLKGGAGMYSQNLFAATSDQDVVNLFYGYLTAPADLQDINGNVVASKIEKSWDVIGGIEADIAKNTTLSIEPYYKDFPQLVTINEYKQFNTDPDYLTESGKSYGVDFLLTYDKNPYYIWVTYSYSKVTYNDGVETFPPFWDRRNSINILAAYKIGKKQTWEVSARWTYGSGFPFTQTQGLYENQTFQGQGVNTNYINSNGTLGVQYAALDGGRLSDYSRLDVSVTKTYTFTRHRIFKVIATATNAYDRANVFYFDRINYVRVNQLPIMPSLSLNYAF